MASARRRATRQRGPDQLDLAPPLEALADTGYDGALAMEFLPATDAAPRGGREHVERSLKAAGS